MIRTDWQATALTSIALMLIGLLSMLMPALTPKTTADQTASAETLIRDALHLLEPMPPRVAATPEPITEPSPETPITPEPIVETPAPIVQPIAKATPKKVKASEPVKKAPVVVPQETTMRASTVVIPEISVPVSPPVTVNPQVAADAGKNYRALLMSILAKNKDYPRLSRRLGEEGTVRIRFTVSSDGRVSALELVASSGFERLDRATLAIFEQLNQQLPIFLDGMDKEPLTFDLPVNYNLSVTE
jgi:protein TonB